MITSSDVVKHDCNRHTPPHKDRFQRNSNDVRALSSPSDFEKGSCLMVRVAIAACHLQTQVLCCTLNTLIRVSRKHLLSKKQVGHVACVWA